MKKPIDHYFDGHATARFEAGSDGTCAMYLCDSVELRERKRRTPGMFPWPMSRLIGWGHDERSTAQHLIQQLRRYADQLAEAYKLPILDQAGLDRYRADQRALIDLMRDK